MFWRKQKAALAGFPLPHQALVWERQFSATQPLAAWIELTGSLQRHNGLVRRAKWALPPRTLDVLVPLLLEVCSDLAPKGMLTVTADLRGRDAPDKSRPPRDLRVFPPIQSATQRLTVDPWLHLRGELRDGSTMEILVVDRHRVRSVTKRSRSGKLKTKRKHKLVQSIKVRRRLPRGVDGTRPAAPPPPWIRASVRDGNRRSVRAWAKLDRLPQDGTEQVDLILRVATEPFRWTPPAGENS